MGSRGHKLTNAKKTTFYAPVESIFWGQIRWLGTTGTSLNGFAIEDSFSHADGPNSKHHGIIAKFKPKGTYGLKY
jgi:hypothetical protein